MVLKENKSNTYGYCPYCKAQLVRNTHDAEIKSGHIIFPALILSAVCFVVFAYTEYVVLIPLAVTIIFASLIYDHMRITRQIPKDWNKWTLASTNKMDKELDMGINPLTLIAIGVLWILLSLITVLINWPNVSTSNVISLLIGPVWIFMGFNKNRLKKKG